MTDKEWMRVDEAVDGGKSMTFYETIESIATKLIDRTEHGEALVFFVCLAFVVSVGFICLTVYNCMRLYV